MKKNTLLVAALTAILSVSTVGVYAESHLIKKDVKLVKRAPKKVEVHINQPNVGILNVELKNEEGASVYKGNIAGGENVTKLFNLNALADGNYTLTCGNDVFWSSQALSIRSGEINIEPTTYQELVAPIIEQYAPNRFKVSTQQPTAAMKVSIYNQNGEEVYKGNLSNSIHFDMTRLIHGLYRFDFTTGDVSISKFVRIR